MASPARVKVEESVGRPCPWRNVHNSVWGGGVPTAATAGGVLQATKGFCDSPVGARFPVLVVLIIYIFSFFFFFKILFIYSFIYEREQA
uniref:Uncharacterized protein n=2 Tax=Canis lupus familiaris TaxID=9615 RepID=A0A8C0SYA2_CANLF